MSIKMKNLLKESTFVDYKFIDAANEAVDEAYRIIMKFNDSVKTDSNHPNTTSVKEKMFKLEEYLDKFGNSINKTRNKF